MYVHVYIPWNVCYGPQGTTYGGRYKLDMALRLLDTEVQWHQVRGRQGRLHLVEKHCTWSVWVPGTECVQWSGEYGSDRELVQTGEMVGEPHMSWHSLVAHPHNYIGSPHTTYICRFTAYLYTSIESIAENHKHCLYIFIKCCLISRCVVCTCTF